MTLGNERVSLSGEGALWGIGPTAEDLVALVRRDGGVRDPLLRQRLARVWGEGEILRVAAAADGLGRPAAGPRARGLGPQGPGRRARPARDGPGAGPGRRRRDAGRHRAAGAVGDAARGRRMPVWGNGYLFSPALTIGGGTSEVQRNIVGERVLGLPRGPAG